MFKLQALTKNRYKKHCLLIYFFVWHPLKHYFQLFLIVWPTFMEIYFLCSLWDIAVKQQW